jgi:hypothetical protein
VDAIEGDARDFRVDTRFALALVPMQTIQVVGGADGRRALLGCVHRHLEPGGVLAAAIAEELETFEDPRPDQLPPPDVAQHGDWVYFIQAVSLREEDDSYVVEHVRHVVSPEGEREETRRDVRLDAVNARGLADEARDVGFDPLPSLEIEPTHEHVGSTVVLLRRP